MYQPQATAPAPLPKQRQHRLPKYLSQREVKRMIEVAENIKHRCILKLLYGAGLRVSEVPALIPTEY